MSNVNPAFKVSRSDKLMQIFKDLTKEQKKFIREMYWIKLNLI